MLHFQRRHAVRRPRQAVGEGQHPLPCCGNRRHPLAHARHDKGSKRRGFAFRHVRIQPSHRRHEAFRLRHAALQSSIEPLGVGLQIQRGIGRAQPDPIRRRAPVRPIGRRRMTGRAANVADFQFDRRQAATPDAQSDAQHAVWPWRQTRLLRPVGDLGRIEKAVVGQDSPQRCLRHLVRRLGHDQGGRGQLPRHRDGPHRVGIEAPIVPKGEQERAPGPPVLRQQPTLQHCRTGPNMPASHVPHRLTGAAASRQGACARQQDAKDQRQTTLRPSLHGATLNPSPWPCIAEALPLIY
ncbi:hypothetical protein D3C86_1043010 [compost metagenome]